MRAPTRVWHLAMDGPASLRPAPATPHVEVVCAGTPLGALNRFFYLEVGRDFEWVDRAEWSPERWQAYAGRPELETWMACLRGTPAGYAELEARPDGVQRINFFGILGPMRGRGIGGYLLTEVTRRAWARGATRVELDTCELDSPVAMRNYLARGYAVMGEGIELRGRSRRRSSRGA